MKTPGRILSDLSVSLGATDHRKLGKYWLELDFMMSDLNTMSLEQSYF